MRPLALFIAGLVSLGAACSAPPPPEAPSSGATPPAAPAADTTEAPDLGPVGPFGSEADYRRQRAETAAALEAAIGTAEASSVEACRVVPTSEQACGGPTSFAVYSAESPDASRVEALAARLVALDAQANRQFERMSTCRAYEPPTPALRDGRCVADG